MLRICFSRKNKTLGALFKQKKIFDMIYQNYKKFKDNNKNIISNNVENKESFPIVGSEINENDNNESNIIKGLLNNINDEEKMELDNDDEEKDEEDEKEKDIEEKMENDDEKINNNEENKDIANDEKSQFKIQLINLLKNNNFMQQRAVKMSITNFLELLNLFNNNGIHFN
jgi:18S rRNA (adenine1779-N6/adenine1780-N6)-dimethyltransferase